MVFRDTVAVSTIKIRIVVSLISLKEAIGELDDFNYRSAIISR